MDNIKPRQRLKMKVMNNRKKRSPRAKRVFEKATQMIMSGEKPNITQLMREEGYAESSCKCQKIVRMDTWKEMLEQVPGDFVLQGFVDLAQQNEDRRTKLNSLKELATLKGLYPQKKTTYEIQQGLSDLFIDEAEIVDDVEEEIIESELEEV